MSVSAVKKEPAKPAADAETAAPETKKRVIKWKLPLIALCVILAGGGGAYWFMNRHHGEESKEAKVEPAKPPQFLPLDAFTVNLQLEDNPQFLQVGLTLKVTDAAAVDKIKQYMPEVRDRILLLLASQKASVLLTTEGKRNLTTDIVASINSIVAPGAAAAAPKKPAAEADAKAAAEAEANPEDDAKPAAEADAKPATEADAKPAAEHAAKPAAASTLPVQSVLFTSFIVQ
jgi:flagellar FliL protein